MSGFAAITIVLTLGLAVIIAATFRANIAANWEANRCEPGVMLVAGSFKPASDPRTRAKFAEDNWKSCQKEYIQGAIRAAAAVPKELAEAEEAVAEVAEDILSSLTDVFVDLWQFCYEAYSSFMDNMKTTAKLFHNMLINLHSIVDRLQGAVLSIVFGLMGIVTAFLSSVQVVLIVIIIIVGIITALMFIFWIPLIPIMGALLAVIIGVDVSVVVVTAAIAALIVAEMFKSGEEGLCFMPGTKVIVSGGGTQPIETLKVGVQLVDGSRVSAVHRFRGDDAIYSLRGIRVTGDHLVYLSTGRLIPVREHPEAVRQAINVDSAYEWFGSTIENDLWCLTTESRRIPCLDCSGERMDFADWEEIAEDDAESLQEWYAEVWRSLNGSKPMRPPSSLALSSEAAISPDCQLPVVDWFGVTWKRALDVRIGDYLQTGTSKTQVIGIVDMGGDSVKDAVELPDSQIVSVGSWILQSGVWSNPIEFSPRMLRPVRWMHLYTRSGQFMLKGGSMIRDASDVGIDQLKPMVESIVLGAA